MASASALSAPTASTVSTPVAVVETVQLQQEVKTPNKAPSTNRYKIVSEALKALKKGEMTLLQLEGQIAETVTFWHAGLDLHQKVSTANLVTMIIRILSLSIKTSRFTFLNAKFVGALLDILLLNLEAGLSRKTNKHPQKWNVLGQELDRPFMLRYMNADIVSLDGNFKGTVVPLGNISLYHLTAQMMVRLNGVFARELPTHIPIDKIDAKKGGTFEPAHLDYRVRLLKACKIIFHGIQHDTWKVLQKAIWSSHNVKEIKKVEAMPLPDTVPVLSLPPAHVTVSLPAMVPVATVQIPTQQKKQTTANLSVKENGWNPPSTRQTDKTTTTTTTGVSASSEQKA